MTLKVFNLSCDQQHLFEGWFTSEEGFEKQSQRRLISCPICGSRTVKKFPSAPRLNLGSAPAQDQGPAKPEHPNQEHAQRETVLLSPAQVQALLLKVAREIAANTEDVGERFADEARRIHYKEAPERGIRGSTSSDEAYALLEEGISIMPMPFGPLVKEPLQ